MRVRLLSLTSLLLGLMLIVCTAPSGPGSESAFIALEFKNSSGLITKNTLTDTIGKRVTISLIHNQAQFIDASLLRITKGTDFNEVYPVRSHKALVDTVNYQIAFTSPGIYAVSFSCYIDGKQTILNGTITIMNAASINRAPAWSITSLQRSAQPETLFSLDVSSYCSDPDSDTLKFSLLTQAPAKDSIPGKLYQLTPALSDTGIYFIPVVATDPSGLSDTFTLELTISKLIFSKPDQIPPTIVLKSPSKDSVITTDSCEVKVTCVDDSGCIVKGYRDGIAFDMKKSLSGLNLWIGMAKGITAGSYSTIKIIATDSSAAKNRDSVSVRITYDNDTTGPKVRLVKPSVKSTATNTSSYSIELNYTDISGILAVKGVCGTNTFSGIRSGDNWVVTVNNLLSGENKVYITATDSSLQANKTIDTLIINYDPTMLDTIGPTITPVSGPSSGATVSSPSVDIVVSVNDPAQVDSVYWTKNSGAKKMMIPVAGKAGLYSLNETLTEGKVDTLTLFAIDKATKHNQTKLVLSLIYSEPRYSVSYKGNDNTSGAAPSDPGSYIQGARVTVASAGSLVRSGYIFTGWNTAADGSGTSRLAESTFDMGSANVTLYAQWKLIPTYTVTYNGNYNTDGNAPTDTVTYVQGARVTVASAGSLVRSGYTFTGWNTAADGSGTSRLAESAFDMGSANVTLYAQWQKIKYLVTFKNNVSNQTNTAYYDSGSTIVSSQYPGFEIGGYKLSYWDNPSIKVNAPITVTAFYTMLDCSISGNSVVLWSGTGETFDLIVTSNYSACKITEYLWYKHENAYDYISDGLDGKSLFTAYGQKSNKLVVSKVSGTFWGISCMVTFENGMKDTITWEARFKPMVNYFPGDGSGNMGQQNFTPGVPFKLNACEFTRTGYRFGGWCVDDCSMGPAFLDQATVTFGNDNEYLTAYWIKE